MSKTVVLGDLGKIKGYDDCLKFNGISDYVDIPTDHSEFDVDFYCKFTPIELPNTYHTLLGKKDKWACYIIETGNIQFFVRRLTGGVWFFNTSSNGVLVGEENNIRCVIDSQNSQMSITLNGVETLFSSQVYDTAVSSNKMYLGAVNTLSGATASLFLNALIWNLNIDGSEYIKNGDFGSLILTDHSENGNDGIIVGAQWWKQDVDENYITPQLYKSTLVTPLTEDQNVIYTDATPYYPSDDVFWNPYNQDLTYNFTVSRSETQQCAGCKTYNYSYSYSY